MEWEAFQRVPAFELEVVFASALMDDELAKKGLTVNRHYYRSSGKLRWIHVCYSDEQAFKQWAFACQPHEKIESTAAQSEANWLVEIVRRIERGEIKNCTQSFFDSRDMSAILAGELPAVDRTVGYKIPNATEAAIMLCKLIVASTKVDWKVFLDKPARTLTWGDRVFDELTPTVIGILELMLQKYPDSITLEELGSYAPEPGQSLGKLFKNRRNGKLSAHPVWQLLERVGRGRYKLSNPKRVTQS